MTSRTSNARNGRRSDARLRLQVGLALLSSVVLLQLLFSAQLLP